MSEEMNYERARASLNRGIAYANREQWQQAINALESALEDDHQLLPAQYYLALCYGHTGNGLHACRLLEDLRDNPRLDDGWRVRVLQLLSKVGIQMREYELAADSLEQAYHLTGAGGSAVLNSLAQVLCKAGNYKRGFELYFKAMP